MFDAVVHGAAGGPIHVVADALGRRLTVSVRHQTRHSDDQAVLPSDCPSDREQLLMIYLAESWDIANEPGAQVVRFVLAIDAPATRQDQTGTTVHQLARHWAACDLLSCVPQPRCP
ncbi:hypothetical protein [Cellulomonas sp. NS3]|uniref:hypothetical protein n=1 Tax=Cellulomonas sp. NS3 TaxID=2973977 RepID=UPI00216220A7|nr:hypothetical protein [Cellulomonas sp. NS3]